MYPCQGVEVRAVACGGEHSLAATSLGEVYSWGWGRYGNLGLGPAEDNLLPSKVPTCPAAARALLKLTSLHICMAAAPGGRVQQCRLHRGLRLCPCHAVRSTR